ncbi:MAG: hypothetical protein JRF63_10545 [Deltaproteobacteria bacterium]|nr:hypothetical protein [Deltaproteobacteria bacterium]
MMNSPSLASTWSLDIFPSPPSPLVILPKIGDTALTTLPESAGSIFWNDSRNRSQALISTSATAALALRFMSIAGSINVPASFFGPFWVPFQSSIFSSLTSQPRRPTNNTDTMKRRLKSETIIAKYSLCLRHGTRPGQPGGQLE